MHFHCLVEDTKAIHILTTMNSFEKINFTYRWEKGVNDPVQIYQRIWEFWADKRRYFIVADSDDRIYLFNLRNIWTHLLEQQMHWFWINIHWNYIDKIYRYR